ncbi:MAG: hypothetical protein K6B43_12785 [Treponema sp.]|nr:hypothetical protein [Treponema sp.]MCR5126048.1 hypothetical protein [Treponema sp.]
MAISEKEKINTAIDLLVALTVEEIATEKKRESSQVLAEFLSSNTARMLYDENMKLWWNGSSAIAELYAEECSAKNQTLA